MLGVKNPELITRNMTKTLILMILIQNSKMKFRKIYYKWTKKLDKNYITYLIQDLKKMIMNDIYKLSYKYVVFMFI